MAINIDALKLREIERGNQFTPIQFGDIARGAVGVAQQFQQTQGALEAQSTKRKQAQQFQQLLNGGQNAFLQAVGQLDPEDQKLVFGGDQNTMLSVTGTQDGLIDGWKRLAEVQASKAGAEAPTFSDKVSEFGKRGVITPKEALAFQKPAAGAPTVSKEGRLILQQRLIDAADKKGDPLTKAEANEIGQRVSVELGIPELGESRIIQFAITSGSLPLKELEREKFTEAKLVRTRDAVRKIGNKFDAKTREIVIAANQLNQSIPGGVFGPQFKSILTPEFVEGLQERLELGGEPESVIATIINAFTRGKIKDQREAERVNRVRRDAKFTELFKNKQFNETFIALSNLMTKVLRKESGAAITGTDIEDKKNNFGFDPLGGPGSFMIGIGNFMDALKANTQSLIETEPDEQARTLFRDALAKNPLTDPSSLPSRRTAEARRSRIEELQRKAAQ